MKDNSSENAYKILEKFSVKQQLNKMYNAVDMTFSIINFLENFTSAAYTFHCV